MDILLTYSSGYGSTREIAKRIASILCQDTCLQIKVEKIDKVQDIKKYDTVIIGCSIRAGEITANVRDFFSAHHYELAQKNVFFFVSGITAHDTASIQKIKNETVRPFLAKYSKLNVVDSSVCGGQIDLSQLNFVMRSFVESLLQQYNIPILPNVDTRNWEEIEGWAARIKSLVRHAA